MHIEIVFDDGRTERVRVRLEGHVLSSGGRMVPGHLVDEPRTTTITADAFEAAIGEGGLRAGRMEPEEADFDPDTGTPSFEPFTWTLRGSEEDACRAKLAKWIRLLGESYDPFKSGEDVFGVASGPPDAPRRMVPRIYDSDRQCVMTYLDDVEAEMDALMDRKTPEAVPDHPTPRFGSL